MRKLAYAGLLAGAVLVPAYGFAQGVVVTVPSEVETYVIQESTPSVAFESDVVVGTVLPDTVVLHAVPKFDTYSYAVVNNRKVIVDARTRKIVKIVK